MAENGGRTRTRPEWIEGAPEMVIEIARSSRSIDLGRKLEEYRNAGVVDYVVVALDPDDVYWYARRGDRFTRLSPDAAGIYRSEAFPGLWLDASALHRRDLVALSAAVDRGIASPEHARFVEELAAREAGD